LFSFVLNKENTSFKKTLLPKKTLLFIKKAKSTKAAKKAIINIFKKDYLIRAEKNKKTDLTIKQAATKVKAFYIYLKKNHLKLTS
jgi:hypothetical protein